MGMDVYATHALGAVVYDENAEINPYDEDFIEKLEDLLAGNSTYDIDHAGYESSTILIVRSDTVTCVDWEVSEIKDIEFLEAKKCFLKQFLKKNKIKYDAFGELVYPYFSH